MSRHAEGAALATGAEIVADCLIEGGVDVLFGLPGDTGVCLYDALYHRTSRIRHVLARDERHAGAMADSYARVRNQVGVVEVSSGGGVTYIVGALGEAFAAGVPVLLITSDIHSSSRNSGALTEIDQQTLLSAVTKWRCMVDRAERIPAAIAEAFQQATSGRPAPVAVILPEDVLDERIAPVPFPAGLTDAARRLPSSRPPADPAVVAEVARALAAARQPAMLAGSGVHLSGAWAPLARLAAQAGLAVATSIQGKGAIPDDDPWSIGVAGNNGGRFTANEYLRECDLVLLVGTRANATDTDSFKSPPRHGTTIVQIDIEATRAGRNYPGSLALVGDIAAVTGQLLAALPPVPVPVLDQRRERISQANSRWADALGAANPPAAGTPLLPADVVGMANRVFGDGCILVADPGTPTPNVAAYWTTSGAGRRVIIPRGHGPMGYAIPAAIGAAVASPGTAVLSMTADGSFAMACGELETAARLRLPVLFIQFTNGEYGWIKTLQHLYHDRRYFGVDIGPIDAVQVARACGLQATRVRDARSLARVLEDFDRDRQPCYVDVPVPALIECAPPVPAWTGALNGDTERPVY